MPFTTFIIRLLLLLQDKATSLFASWEGGFIFKMPADSSGNRKVKLSIAAWLQFQNTHCFFLTDCILCHVFPLFTASMIHMSPLTRFLCPLSVYSSQLLLALPYWSFSHPLYNSLFSLCSITCNSGGGGIPSIPSTEQLWLRHTGAQRSQNTASSGKGCGTFVPL